MITLKMMANLLQRVVLLAKIRLLCRTIIKPLEKQLMPDRALSSGHLSPPSQFFWGRLRPLMRLLVLPLLLATLLPTMAHAGDTTAPSQPRIDATQAKQLLGVLNDEAKRKQFVATLTNLTAAQNATRQVSLPDQVLNSLSTLGDRTMKQLHALHQNVVNFRSIGPWTMQVWQSKPLQNEIIRVLLRVALMIVGSFVLFHVMKLALQLPRRKLDTLAQDNDRRRFHREAQKLKEASAANAKTEEETHGPSSASDKQDNTADTTQTDLDEQLRRQGALSRLLISFHRLPYTIGNAVLDGLMVLMFPLTALLIQSVDPSPDNAILHSVWSIAWLAGIGLGSWVIILRALLAPKQPWFRLTVLQDYSAKFLYSSLHNIAAVLAWGYTALIVLHNCTLPTSVSLGLEKLLALVVHLMVAVMILRARSMIKRACDRVGVRNHRLAALMHIIARGWWIVALFFDFALWLVWAADIQGGYAAILHLFVRTCIALVVMRVVSILAYGGLSRLTHALTNSELSQETQTRILRYYPTAQRLLAIIIALLTLFALTVAWGAPVYSIFGQHTLGAQLFSSIVTIIIALLIGVVAWEVVNVSIEHQIRRLGQKESVEQQNRMARLRTLQPMFRILLLVVLVIVIGLTVLSQLGINTGPLLASASIFGVALGFGSQKLVQDFISGIFLLMENALTVGDSVTLNGTYGVVEKLSLRSVHVRANDGSMNIFSFSSLGQVTNYNRDFSRAMIAIDVSYDTDTDVAVQAILDIAKGLRQDPAFASHIIADFNLWGVASLNDFSVTIRGTFPTTTSGRWPVEWEFYRRVKKTFEERNITIPFPTRTINVQNVPEEGTPHAVPSQAASVEGAAD